MAKSLSQTGGFVGREPIHEEIIYNGEPVDIYFKDQNAEERDATAEHVKKFPERSRAQMCQLLSRVLHADGPDSPIITYEQANDLRDSLLMAIIGAWIRVTEGPKA